ncbi:MAG: hypothetical protein J0H68_09775 [Sphingobacteriia bacterium]|nr:hypothetical protein [Sphingobacteriia bacterium]
MTESTKTEFRKALVNEANKEFFGWSHKYLNYFLPDKLQTNFRLVSPHLCKEKKSFLISFVVANIIALGATHLNKRLPISIPGMLLKPLLGLIYCRYLYKKGKSLFSMNFEENHQKVLRFDNLKKQPTLIQSDFDKALNELQIQLKSQFRNISENAMSTLGLTK